MFWGNVFLGFYLFVWMYYLISIFFFNVFNQAKPVINIQSIQWGPEILWSCQVLERYRQKYYFGNLKIAKVDRKFKSRCLKYYILYQTAIWSLPSATLYPYLLPCSVSRPSTTTRGTVIFLASVASLSGAIVFLKTYW